MHVSTCVFKYPFRPTDIVKVVLPLGAKILHCDERHGQWVVWALVDPTQPPQDRFIRMAGTGHILEGDNWRHINTAVLRDSGLVFHFFERAT